MPHRDESVSETLSRFRQVLASVRNNWLAYIGVIGMALTLLSKAEDIVRIGRLLKSIADHWITITSAIWRSILFLPKIEALDAQLLNILSFVFANLLACIRGNVAPRTFQIYTSCTVSGIILTLFFQAGFRSAFSRAEALEQTGTALELVYKTAVEVYAAVPGRLLGALLGWTDASVNAGPIILLASACLYLLLLFWLWQAWKL